MRQDAFVSLIALCAVAMPVLVWLILRWRGGLAQASWRLLATLYSLGALMCVVVLLRKHIEVKIIMLAPRSYWAYTLAQVDNEWWEQIGKLAAIALALWIFKEPLRSMFMQKRSALSAGYWAGLGYGCGEALILAILFILPGWGPFFGVQTFTPYMVGWAYVWERLWAMNLHAVMGALIGLGLYGYFALGSRRQLAGFFVLAMLYHHFVDGMIITAGFVPSLANIMNSLGSVVVILDLALGLVFLALVYRSQRVSGAAAKPPDANVTVVDSA